MAKITDYQRVLWLCLSYMTLCKFYIVRDPKNGDFVIKKAGRIRLFFYYALWLNAVTKITYLTLAYRKYLPVEVHFLDQMGENTDNILVYLRMVDWFLTFSQLVQETNMWCRKYPLFEILCSNWKIQEDVFRKLGSPDHVEKSILKNDRSLVRMHTLVVVQGCLAILIQFFIAPKYAANIYAVVPYDNWILRIIFCAHEVMYVYHIWVYQICSIMICEVFASSYTHIIREMTVVFKQLIDLGIQQQNLTLITQAPAISQDDNDKDTSKNGDGGRTNSGVELTYEDNVERKTYSAASNSFRRKYIAKRLLNPKTKVPGTEYDVMTLLHDYEKLMLATNSFNAWVGFLMGGTMGSNYSQFVTDVFMMIQLLKEPETDMLAVTFYAGDALAGMLILFRMLIIISRLYPASQEFLHVLKQYLTYDTPLKSYLLRYQRGLRIIASNLGGYKTKAITVPKGINTLMQWYINAALWQRPADRRT